MGFVLSQFKDITVEAKNLLLGNKLRDGGDIRIYSSGTEWFQASTGQKKIWIKSDNYSYGQLQIGNPSAREVSIAFIPLVTQFGTPPSSSAGYTFIVGTHIYGIGADHWGIGETFQTSNWVWKVNYQGNVTQKGNLSLQNDSAAIYLGSSGDVELRRGGTNILETPDNFKAAGYYTWDSNSNSMKFLTRVNQDLHFFADYSVDTIRVLFGYSSNISSYNFWSSKSGSRINLFSIDGTTGNVTISTGNLYLANDKAIYFKDSGGTYRSILSVDDIDQVVVGDYQIGTIYIQSSSNIYIGAGGSLKWKFDASTGYLLPYADNTYSLGNASYRLKEGWFVDGLVIGDITSRDDKLHVKSSPDSGILVESTGDHPQITLKGHYEGNSYSSVVVGGWHGRTIEWLQPVPGYYFQFTAPDATSTATLRAPWMLRFRCKYWDGSTSQNFDIELIPGIIDTTPTGKLRFRLNGTDILELHSSEGIKHYKNLKLLCPAGGTLGFIFNEDNSDIFSFEYYGAGTSPDNKLRIVEKKEGYGTLIEINQQGNVYLYGNNLFLKDNKTRIHYNSGQPQIILYNSNSTKYGYINRWANRLEILSQDEIRFAIGSIDSNRLYITDTEIIVARLLRPGSENGYDIGNSTYSFRNAYFKGVVKVGSLQISDTEVLTSSRVLTNVRFITINKGGTSQTVNETSSTLKQTISADSGYSYLNYIEGVKFTGDNPTGSSVTLYLQIRALQDDDSEVNLTEWISIPEGESYSDTLRWLYDVIGNGRTIKAIRLYAYCSGTPVSGYEPSVKIDKVSGLQV